MARLHSLLRYVVVLTGDHDLAQDVLQEVLARAQVPWRRISEAESPEAYVRRMVLNEYLSWRRTWAVRHRKTFCVSLQDIGTDLVRWGAAVALARLHGPAADAAVATELLAWAGGDGPSRPEIPYLDGDTAGYAGLALRQIGDAYADAAFDALLARIPVVSGPQALPVVGEALRRAFSRRTGNRGHPFRDLGLPTATPPAGPGRLSNDLGMGSIRDLR